MSLRQATAALLYLGPLLAGFCGQGFLMSPLFIALLVLRTLLLTTEPAPLPLAAYLAPRILLILLCFALGRGFGGVLGLTPTIPVLLPALLSFLAIPLAARR